LAIRDLVRGFGGCSAHAGHSTLEWQSPSSARADRSMVGA
jgi:hypothetical protein